MKGFSTHQSARWRHPTRTEFCQTKEEIFTFICFEFDYISIKKTLNHRLFMILTALNLFLLFFFNLNQWGPTLGFNKKKWWFPFQIKNTLTFHGCRRRCRSRWWGLRQLVQGPTFLPVPRLGDDHLSLQCVLFQRLHSMRKKKNHSSQLKYCSRI